MSEHPSDTNENRLRATVAGALAFVSFGLLTALILLIADFKTGADAAVQGIFTPEQVQARSQNLSEVKAAQAALFDSDKVKAAMAKVAGAAAKPGKVSATIIPGSETDLKNQAASAAAAKAAESKAPEAVEKVPAPAQAAPTTPAESAPKAKPEQEIKKNPVAPEAAKAPEAQAGNQ